MNKVEELLIKYGFIEDPMKDINLDEIAQRLDKSIIEIFDKSKKQYNYIKHEEVKLINEILNITRQPVANRIDSKLDELLNYNLYMGKSIHKLENIRKELNISIENQIKKEEQLILLIKKEVGMSMFKELEHELISDEFLEYITK